MLDPKQNQIGLFDGAITPSLEASEFREIITIDGDAVLQDHFFHFLESSSIFEKLHGETIWQQDYLKIYGKDVPLPRLTAWYGDRGRDYTYSHILMQPDPWTDLLLSLKERVEKAARASFNSVLLNLYRSGNDGVSWHQDNEPELGPTPTIASLSFGATRGFQMKHKFKTELPRVEIPLLSGSLLIMRGQTQKFWQHRIPKTQKSNEPRINLTFRHIHQR